MKIKFAYTMYRIIITNNFHCTHSSSFHNWRSWILLGTVYMEGRRSQYQEDPRGESSWRQIVKMFSVFSLHVKSCTCKLFVAAFAREKTIQMEAGRSVGNLSGASARSGAQ